MLTTLFEDYLMRQTVERRLQIRAAEREYIKQYGPRLATATHVFRECMMGLTWTWGRDEMPQGLAAGRDRSHSPYQYVLAPGETDLWKPVRDKKLGDKMITFRGVPPSAAELYGRRSYSPA